MISGLPDSGLPFSVAPIAEQISETASGDFPV